MSDSISRMLAEIEKLPVTDKLELLEKVIHSLKSDQTKDESLNWDELYGLGKGLWEGVDAQDYVNQLRSER